MACEYCTNDDELHECMFSAPDAVMFVDDDCIRFTSQDSDGTIMGARVEITFCPMCGRKLGGDA